MKYWFIGDRDGICTQRLIHDRKRSFAKSAGRHCKTIEEARELLSELRSQEGWMGRFYIYRADVTKESIGKQ